MPSLRVFYSCNFLLLTSDNVITLQQLMFGDLQVKLAFKHEVWCSAGQCRSAAYVCRVSDAQSHSFADSFKPFITLPIVVIVIFILYSATTAALSSLQLTKLNGVTMLLALPLKSPQCGSFISQMTPLCTARTACDTVTRTIARPTRPRPAKRCSN